MRELSNFIPKAMLPFAKGRLIDYQIHYLRSLGVETIIVNTHHHHDLMSDYLKAHYPDIKIIFEPVLLGSGGVFHNLKALGFSGSLISINADSFFFLQKDDFTKKDKKAHHLFGLKVQANENYNRLVIDDQNYLQKIVKNSATAPDLTFSGVSLIQLDLIDTLTEGVSSFFDTVALPGLTKVIRPMREIESWDFGTVEDYFRSINKFVSQEQSGESHLSHLVQKAYPPADQLPKVLAVNQMEISLELNKETRATITDAGVKILESLF